MSDPVVSPADTIRRAREHAGYDSMPEVLREPFLALADLADALLAAGERDRQQITRLTATYCDPQMWRETWLENGAAVWEFLCASDCDEPWNPSAVLAGEEDAE